MQDIHRNSYATGAIHNATRLIGQKMGNLLASRIMAHMHGLFQICCISAKLVALCNKPLKILSACPSVITGSWLTRYSCLVPLMTI